MKQLTLYTSLMLALLACDPADPVDPIDAEADATVDASPDLNVDPPDTEPVDMAMLRGVLETDAAALDFGLVAIGSEGTVDLVLRNTGEGPVEITGFDGLVEPFSTNRSLPFSVPPAAERTVVLSFAADVEGVAMQTITVVSDAEGEPVVVDLTATAARPEGMLRREVLDFGTIDPSTPAADFIEVQNTGEALDLTVLEVIGLMPPFEIPVGQTPTIAPPGEAGRVLVQFNPEADGEWTNPVTVRTTAGDFEMTVVGRALVPGELVLTGVEPAWAPIDADRRIVVHGGPFAVAPDSMTVGDVQLTELERIDEWRLAGTLPAVADNEDPVLGAIDLRVDSAAGFGVLSGALLRTGPVGDGQTLDLAAIEGEQTIGPEGNPWGVVGDRLAAGTTLIIQPGTVLLFGGRLTVDGILRAGSVDGPTVLSTADCGADGTWDGLSFTENDMSSSLTRVQIECTGSAFEGPALTIEGQSTGLTQLAVRGGGAGCIGVDDGSLTMVGGALTGCNGPGIALTPTASVFRLQSSRIRGATWPITGYANNFGRLPIGAGHDWRGNTHDAIGLGRGFGGDVTLASQPAGVRYRIIDELLIGRGSTLALNIGSPLVLDGPIRVEGTLRLPGRTRMQAEAGGRIALEVGGNLVVGGMPGQPTVIEAREDGGDPDPGRWGGIGAAEGSTITGAHLTVRDAGADDAPAIMMRGVFGTFEGMVIEDSAGVGLFIDGDGEIAGLSMAGNPGGIEIAGGEGTLSGLTTDPAPALHYGEAAVCDGWDTEELLDGMGIPAASVCAEPPPDPPEDP